MESINLRPSMIAAAAAVALFGCSPSQTSLDLSTLDSSSVDTARQAAETGVEPEAGGPPRMEVIHWWNSGGERAAVSVFQREFDRTSIIKWQAITDQPGPIGRADPRFSPWCGSPVCPGAPPSLRVGEQTGSPRTLFSPRPLYE